MVKLISYRSIPFIELKNHFGASLLMLIKKSNTMEYVVLQKGGYITKTITIRIPDEIYDELIGTRNEINSRIQDFYKNGPRVTISSIIRTAIEWYLEQ